MIAIGKVNQVLFGTLFFYKDKEQAIKLRDTKFKNYKINTFYMPNKSAELIAKNIN